MALSSDSIPNLLNGVSQQAAILRHPTQGRFQRDCYSSIVDGLIKRPPFTFVDEIGPSGLPNAFYHIINRGEDEQYLLIIKQNDVLVYDLINKEYKTVNSPDGTSYVNLVNPDNNIRAITVADYTFIVDTKRVVAKDSAVTAAGQKGAVIVIRQGSYSCKYTVAENAAGTIGTFTTSATDPTTIRTDEIATQLATSIDAKADWTAHAEGNTVWFYRTDNADFSPTVTDSIGGDGILLVKDKVNNFSELPPVCREGIAVEVSGDPGTDFDNFYVHAVAKNMAPQGPMIWDEIAQREVQNELDASTMPHILVRESDGTFTFSQTPWGKRRAGDDTTNPFPSFVGDYIKDVFFYKNRLGFLSGENLIASRPGEYFEFFRETATTKLDSDPIDVGVSTNQVANLEHAIPYKDQLLVFAENINFELKGNPLTSESAYLDPATRYPYRTSVKPVASGVSVFFPFDRKDWTGVRELYSDIENQTDAEDITEHVPSFIPGECVYMAHSETESVLFLTTEQSQDRLYVYKYHYENTSNGREKVQSSWSYWHMPSYEFLFVGSIQHEVYVVLKDKTNLDIELAKFSLQPDIRETDMDFNILLDMKVYNDDLIGAGSTFDGNNTTFYLPYGWDDTVETVELVLLPYASSGTDASSTDITADITTITADWYLGNAGSLQGGARKIQVSADGVAGTATFSGDLTARNVALGLRYNAIYQFTNPTVKEKAQSGKGTVPITEGTLILLFWAINFTDSGWFSAKVFYEDGTDRQYIYNGPLASAPMPTGQLKDGTLKFPIRANTRSDLIIEIQNDRPYPSQWVNAGWEGNFVLRSRRF